MAKVTHMVMDEHLLSRIDEWAGKLGISRSELVRQACQRFLTSLQEKAYVQAYLEVPESSDAGEAQVGLMAEVMGQEADVNASR